MPIKCETGGINLFQNNEGVKHPLVRPSFLPVLQGQGLGWDQDLLEAGVEEGQGGTVMKIQFFFACTIINVHKYYISMFS